MPGQYLRSYAEPEAHLAAVPGAFAHVVVIPACGEGENLLAALATIATSPTLGIVVINERIGAPAWVGRRNATCRSLLHACYGAGTAHGPSGVLRPTPWGTLLCLERILPEKQGVGLARKIGCDAALAQIVRGAVHSRFIHCTDADALLPADYLLQTAGLPHHVAAALYNFEHVPEADPALAAAIVEYDTSLRYYVHGLQLSESPYAFQTIGSTVCVNAMAYAKVRGFPRRNAAEDFYLLDKLAKVGPVLSLGGAPIKLAGRISQRVPFGTGKAVWRLVTCDNDLRVYHPDVFVYLQAWVAILNRCAHTPLSLQEACLQSRVPAPELLWQTVAATGAPAAIDTAWQKTRGPQARHRFLHTWFDALRTLRFVHALRDILGTLPLADALLLPPFCMASNSLPSLRKALAEREQEHARKRRLQALASHDTTCAHGESAKTYSY